MAHQDLNRVQASEIFRYFEWIENTLVKGYYVELWLQKSKSKLCFDSQSASLSCCQAPIWDPRPIFHILSLNIFRQLLFCWCGAPSLTRSRVCSFQFLLVIAAFLRSESHWDSPNPECLVPVFISPRNRVAQLHPRALGFMVTEFIQFLQFICPSVSME
jgi:hypothetical protein